MYARWWNDSHSLTRLARISDLGWPFYITDFDRASWLVCHHYLQHLASYQIYRRNGFIFNRLYFFACTFFIIRTERDLYFFFPILSQKTWLILFPHIFAQLTDYPNVSFAFNKLFCMNFQTALLLKTTLSALSIHISLQFDLSLAILIQIILFYIQ